MEPKHFSKEDVFYSFFGALFFGIVFISKGLLIDIANNIDTTRMFFLILTTVLLVTTQIYYIGYVRVKEKERRKFSQFWAKRFVTICLASVLTSSFLIYLFGVNVILGKNVAKAIVAVSMPCALGATLSDLLKKIKT